MAIRQDITTDYKGDPIAVIGADYSIRLYVMTGDPVICSGGVAAAATAVPTQPLTAALSSGVVIRFPSPDGPGVLATLTSNAAVGATQIAVSALPGSITYGQQGRQVVDITGWTLKWMLKKVATDADSAAVLTKTTTGGTISITDAANGQCDVAVARTDTIDVSNNVLIPAADYQHSLGRTDSGHSTPLTYGTFRLSNLPTK